MKHIKLARLELTNFKGVRSFILDASCESVKTYGDNGTGKTTLFDSFIWLLFDKDSQNKKDFQIKTLNQSGEALHGLSHEVEAVFDINGSSLTLRKVFTEKWTKRRGSIEKEFSGHSTDYYIDGVPSKKKEYSDKVSELIDENIFKLLTSPTYFNEQLTWDKRREILLSLCGDVTDQEVIQANKDLASLPDMLQSHSIDNYKKIIIEKRASINKEIEKIPVRIDEARRNMSDINGLNPDAIEQKVLQLNGQIDDYSSEINNIRNGKAISDKHKAIAEIELQMMDIKRDHESGTKDQVYQYKARIQEEQSNIHLFQSKLENLEQRRSMNEASIKELNKTADDLRAQWHEVNQKTFEHSNECVCPSCGQDLPEEQIQAARDKALASFNLDKSSKLERIQSKGKATTAKIADLNSANEGVEKETSKIQAQINEKKKTVEKLKTELDKLQASTVDITENKQYMSKLKEKEALQQQIQEIRNQSEHSIHKIQLKIEAVKSERDKILADLAKFQANEQTQIRINELSKLEKELAAEYERLEGELYLIEEFVRTKVLLLEDKLNSRFKYARFKLFKTQINGGIQETCETLYKGVPYSSGLNNAAKINIGLDICSTLQEHYGVKAPVWIDNRESVSKLNEIDCQLISLIVSEKDKELRVEVDACEAVHS